MKKNDLNKKENFKKWLFRTPEQRYIDKITHKMKFLKMAQKLPQEQLLVKTINIAEIFDYSAIDYEEEIENDIQNIYRTPILMGSNHNLLAGFSQIKYLLTKDLKKVDAVFIDSLIFKEFSLENLKAQFCGYKQSWIFLAYNLCNFLKSGYESISYEDFCINPAKYFYFEDLQENLFKYLKENDFYF